MYGKQLAYWRRALGTSVGALTTVVGFIAVGAPVESGPLRFRRIWAFILAAALLVAFTIVAALLGHPFWSSPAEQYQAKYNNFFKDIAVCGGLLYVFVRGAGPLSIDRR